MASKRNDTSRHAPEEVDEYLERLPKDRQAALVRLRKIIRKTIPDCTERISYQMPIFRYNKDIVGFASQKNHCSLYTMSPDLIKNMKNDLIGLKVKGTTIHFGVDDPIPEEIVVKILKYRLSEVK